MVSFSLFVIGVEGFWICGSLVQGDGLLADYDSYESSADNVGYGVIVLEVLHLHDLRNFLSALMVTITMAYSVHCICYNFVQTL